MQGVLLEIASAVKAFCGLDYTSNLTGLQMKLNKRIAEIDMTYAQYHNYLKKHPSEWQLAVELLTINETYFYREDGQLQLFQKKLLFEAKQKKMFEPVRVWSAACSSGEEPYTIAMLAMETGLLQDRQLEIYATDINGKVLEKAKQGKYHKNSLTFRRCPSFLEEKYFEKRDDYLVVKESIKKMVKFRQLNLLDAQDIQSLPTFDLIFCRNVLIYFDTKTIQKIGASFYDKLTKNGILLLGHAESLSNMDLNFSLCCEEGAFYYRKGD